VDRQSGFDPFLVAHDPQIYSSLSFRSDHLPVLLEVKDRKEKLQ
jgi:hypothetical protein